ncbi:MAG: pyrroline-5-carboxylate reductase [Bacillota bacterium]
MDTGFTLGVIGCGQMARALLGGFTECRELLTSISLFDIDSTKAEALAGVYGADVADSGYNLAQGVDVVVLAVKPPQVKAVLKEIAPALDADKVLVSLAAGVTLDSIRQDIDPNIPVARVMPNVSCLIGQGVMGLSFSSSVADDKRELILRLFSTTGLVEIVPEEYMDAVTAVSGSGPAFVFLVAEALTDAAVDVGLPRDLARRLVNQTLIGSAIMMRESGEHPAVLRERVTSPGGTTIAGLRALERGGIRAAFFDAVREAYQRAAGR